MVKCLFAPLRGICHTKKPYLLVSVPYVSRNSLAILVCVWPIRYFSDRRSRTFDSQVSTLSLSIIVGLTLNFINIGDKASSIVYSLFFSPLYRTDSPASEIRLLVQPEGQWAFVLERLILP